jgi:hypothetical protein
MPVTLEPVTRDKNAYRRRRYDGTPGRGGDGAAGTVPTGYRNGLPEPRRYVYRGTGADIYAGQYGDEQLDGPAF